MRALVFFIVIGLISCKSNNLYDWCELDNSFTKINISSKGNNGYKGSFIVENNDSRKPRYSIVNDLGEVFDLNINVDNLNKSLLYYEFIDDKLFVIINYFLINKIEFKVFESSTGNLIIRDYGIIPCEYDVSERYKPNWKIGNNECEWIDLKSKNISFIKQNLTDTIFLDSINSYKLEFNVLSYNWKELEFDTVKRNISITSDPVSGVYLGSKNIKYKKSSMSFNYGDDY